MSWLTNVVLPKIRAVVSRKAVPDNLWNKCPGCEQMLFYRELEANFPSAAIAAIICGSARRCG
jgi:acetyl-CoA carboxylase carboxyl transferase subunit beta